MKHLLSSFAVLGLFLFSSKPADACAAKCVAPQLVPAAGATVPASAPGFLLIGGSGADTGVQLVDSNGAVVAGSFLKDNPSGETYFAPSSPLAPGSYATRSPKACATDEIVETAFTVTPSVALPTATGSISAKKFARETLSASTSSGSCTEQVDASYVDLEVAVDPALAPYLAVATWQTTVDGKWWSKHDPIERASAPHGNARSYVRVFTPCDGKKLDGRDPGTSAGKHSVEVRAFVPGAPALSPASLTIELTCDGGRVVADDGGSDAGSGEAVGAESDAPAGFCGVGLPSSDGSSAESGCAATPHASTASTSIGAALVALLALAGLRRRRDSRE